MNYDEIKMLAADRGEKVADWLALSPGNDPFYVGAPGQAAKAEWFAEVYRRMGRPGEAHIRRVHYWLVSKAFPKPDGTPYENTEKDWQLVTMAAKYARYLELVPVENIVDRRNPPPVINAHYWDHETPREVRDRIDAESIRKQIVDQFVCFNPARTQAYMLEVWCEKSTMNDVLNPLCQSHGANLVTGLGELSITAVYQLMERIQEADKPTRIFYVSDFDPAGECMPVSVSRKIEYFVESLGMRNSDVKLLPVMLTAEQCRKYKLQRTPIKETERRRDGFEGKHGSGATELDALEALHPGEMAKIIRGYLLDYFDVDAWNDAIRKNREVKAAVDEFLAGKIDDALMADFDTAEFDEYEPPVAEAGANEDGEDWLYDSERDYVQQLDRYKDHQNS